MTQRVDIERILAQHVARLQAVLQHVSGDSSGSEEGSDGWLLLNALIDKDHYDEQELITRFEQAGRWLAERDGKLDARLYGLQRYVDALTSELKKALPLESMVEALEHLYRIHATSALALARGYQETFDQRSLNSRTTAQQLEQRLAAIQRINNVSNSTVDLDLTLETIAQVVAEELHVDLCSIFFYDELQRVLTLRATNGCRPLGGMHYALRLGEGYSGWAAEKGQTLIVADALTDANFALEARAYHIDFRGLMALPIIFFGNDQRLIGVISVQSSEPRNFTQDEINFVEIVAGIVAINVENGRLYEQTDEQLRRKVNELGTFHHVSSLITSTLNLDEVLQMITTQAVHLSGAEHSCIFELDPDRQRLHVLAHYGINSEVVSSIHIGVGQCCAGRCVQTGRPSMAVDCFQKDENCFLHNDPMISPEIHFVLCVPLKARQKVLGCICIYSSHRHPLSPEQMQLVLTFANEAAIAIENARLYEETRQGLKLKSVLLRELNHRVKNNLATVAGILSLQRRRTRSEEVRNTLSESVSRVQGLAATHELLAQEDVGEARVDDIARKIVGVASAHLSPPDKHINFQVEACPVVIPSRAVTVLALVINEMISNAIKHGLAHECRGSVIVRGCEQDGMVVVQVLDTGPGPQAEITPSSSEEGGEGLGLSLIKNLISDLGGSFSLHREAVSSTKVQQERDEAMGRSEICTVAEVRFPLARRS